MKLGKRGQFYIIAALIIVGLIVGMFVVSNYAIPRKRATKIYDLGEELNVETGNVYNYGIYNKNLTEELKDNWTSEYSRYSQSAAGVEDWIFIYGDENEIVVSYFTKNKTGEVCVGFVSGSTCIETIGTYVGRKTIFPGGENIIRVEFGGVPYEFEIKKGEENFFFIISSSGEVTSG